MKHLVKIKTDEDGFTLTMAIRVSREEAEAIAEKSDDEFVRYPQDLMNGYEQQGIKWFTHLLRLYLFFSTEQDKPLPAKRIKKPKSKKQPRKKRKMITNLDELGVSHYVMASYLYYVLDKPSPLSDSTFDQLAQKLLRDWKKIDHPHKRLLSRETLKAGTLFDLNESDYPLMAKHAAVTWAHEHGIQV